MSIIFRNNRKEIVLERSIPIVHQLEIMILDRIHSAKELPIDIPQEKSSILQTYLLKIMTTMTIESVWITLLQCLQVIGIRRG
jgi:hypothetical protein